ncbi:MAG: hypothetical protein IPK32_19680 [Verrucomicrobiaceae bacterium]|nr:hypothetical protein [Verrucomicrobiaceae bacterium]
MTPGNYFIKVTQPADYAETSGTPATTDNNVNNNNDGSQPGGPGTPVFSPIINLAIGAETNAAGTTNTDTNATLDFGFWNSVSVGNVVFFDFNGDGNLDVNEGLEGVLVFIYTQGSTVGVTTPAGVAFTDNKGRYLITGLNPGNYFLHIPSSQFAASMPLEGYVPMSSIVAGDDTTGQDLLAAATPATTGASTGIISLRPTLCPAGVNEAGFEASTDDATDTRVDLTRDLGFINGSGTGFANAISIANTLALPAFEPQTTPAAEMPEEVESTSSTTAITFASWSAENQISGAEADADADSASNLLEYALGTDPRSSLITTHFSLEHNTTTDAIDAIVTRPVDGREDIRVTLEAASILDDAAWKTLALPAAALFNQDGTVTRRYAAIDADSTTALGFLRLRIDLDADKDGTPESTTHSAAQAWTRQAFTPGTRTFSMPLLNAAAYIGTADITADSVTLTSALGAISGPHYLEVLNGTHAGLRLEIGHVDATHVTLQTSAPATLTSARIAIRAHQHLTSLLPAERFTAASDTVRFLDAGAFATIPLTASGWSIDRILHPHEAVLVTVRGEQPITVVLTGEVRAATATHSIPLTAGTQLIAPGLPIAAPVPTTGLLSGPTADSADRLRIWNGDITSELAGYSSFFLQSSETAPQWTPQSENTLAAPLMKPFHGLFIVRDTALNWKP